MGSTRRFVFLSFLLISVKCSGQAVLTLRTDSARYLPALRLLPQNFYTQNMGAVCKWELQLQKKSALPVYFRLGSKAQVDFLEGKQRQVDPLIR